MKRFLRIISPFFLLVIIPMLLLGCKAQRVDTQGIIGQVFWIEGNQMPRISEKGTPPTDRAGKEGIKRTIRVYELTHINQAVMGDKLFETIETPMVAEFETEEDGTFVIGLPPGRYSLFTVEENGYFASVYNLDSYIQPIEVNQGQWTEHDILINYQAAY